ncbi:MAG: type 4a pilus biogenesis protein PilO [Phycisphaerae bacterium]
MRSDQPFWKHRQIELAAVGLVLAMTAALALLGIEPLLDDYETQQRQAQQLNARKAEDHKLLATRRKLRQSMDQLQQDLVDSPLQLRSDAEINVRVSQLNRLAEQVGASIEEIRLASPALHPRYRTMPINLLGRGSWQSFLNLLARIGETFPDTAVTKLELLGDGGQSGQAPRFEVQLIWYARNGAGGDDALAREDGR